MDELTLRGLQSLSEKTEEGRKLQRELSIKMTSYLCDKTSKPFLGSLYGRLRRLRGTLTYLSLTFAFHPTETL